MDYKIIWIVGKNNWNMNEGYKLRIKTFILHFLIIVKSYYLLVSQLAPGKKYGLLSNLVQSKFVIA